MHLVLKKQYSTLISNTSLSLISKSDWRSVRLLCNYFKSTKKVSQKDFTRRKVIQDDGS